MSRTKPHAKIHVSVNYHDRTAEAWAELESRAILVELWRLGIEQYAAKRDDRVSLGIPQQMQVAASLDAQESLVKIRETCKKVGYRVDEYPNRVVVTVRNLAKKQGIGDKEKDTKADKKSKEKTPQNTESRVQKAESREQTQIQNGESDLDLGSGASRRKPRKSSRRQPVPCPDRLTDEERAKLIKWAAPKGWNESHCRWAWNATKEWARRHDKRMVCWYSAVQGYMRDGWVLKGYRETEAERYQREMAESPFRDGGDS